MTDLFGTIQQVPYTAPAQAPAQTSVQVKEAVSTQQVPVEDKVEISTKQKEKKGPIKAVKGFIAGVKKFFASTGEYAKGTAKGLVSGAMLGSFVYTVGDIANKVKKKSGKAHMVIAGVAAAGTLAANLWKASLNATEKSTNIDHRYMGHKQ